MNCVTPLDPTDLAARPRAMLHELAELALELAREVQRQAIGQARSADPGIGAGLLFTRVARTLRQIIALDSRIADDQQARTAGTAAERARRAAGERHRKREARQQLRRRLADAVHADTTGRDTDTLLRDLDDRLYRDDIDAALAIEDLTDIVVALCAEFGLKPDLSHLTDEELARRGSPDPVRLSPTFLDPD